MNMQSLNYVTGNPLKFSEAEKFFKTNNIELIQQKLNTYEIQDFDSVAIAVSKSGPSMGTATSTIVCK